MFILSSIFNGLEFWSINYTLSYWNSELNVFKNIKYVGAISNNYLMIYLEKIYEKLLNLVDNHC